VSLTYTNEYPSHQQAQKFGRGVEDVETEEELGEDTVLLESPLDKIEPYQLFRATFMSKFPRPEGSAPALPLPTLSFSPYMFVYVEREEERGCRLNAD
jgi:hypothetical protein